MKQYIKFADGTAMIVTGMNIVIDDYTVRITDTAGKAVSIFPATHTTKQIIEVESYNG